MIDIRPIKLPPRATEDSYAIGRELWRLEQLNEAYVSYRQHHAVWVGGEPDSYDVWLERHTRGLSE